MPETYFCITLYSLPLCEPCKNLKAWFAEKKIPYNLCDLKSLDPESKEYIGKAISAVSRIRKVTVPAVRIRTTNDVHWLSNHGEMDISEMTGQIEKILALPR